MRRKRINERAAAGFTLLEILLALALIALLTTVFIGGSSALISEQKLAPDDQFWKVCGEARKAALEGGHDVLLSFDTKTGNYVLTNNGSTRNFSAGSASDLAVDFLSTQKDASAILVGGTVMETQTIPYVTFYGDGTCSPFRVQLRTKTDAHVLSIDPWTCAPVLKPNNGQF